MGGAFQRGAHLAQEACISLPEEQSSADVSGSKFVPLSFSQQQLWYVCQFQGGTIAYNQPVAWRLTGRVDTEALEASLNAIVRRHEALRTTFPLVDGSPLQCIHEDFPLTQRSVDLRGVPETGREARVQELILEEARYPFGLDRELLLRAALLQTGEEEYVFVVVVHHIVCDGWSMGILIQELAYLYRVFSSGHASELPDPAIQYSDFAVLQRDSLQGENLERQVAYWKHQLEGAAILELPSDRPRRQAPGFRGASQAFVFPKDVTAAFKALCAKEGVFLFMGLLAAFQALAHRYTGQTDIVVGAPVASRKRAKTQKSIGLFLNLIALRTDLSGDPTFRELLKRVCDVVMGAYQHQELPFEKVVEEVQPARDPSRSPLFQVMLDQVDARWIALDLEGVRSEWFSVDNQTSKFDLTLAWSDSAEGLRGWLEYDTDLYDSATAKRMLGHYRTILQSVIANPERRISSLPMLTPSEQQQLAAWNATAAEYPSQACIHDLFEMQVRATPEAAAIVAEESQISYIELNRRANQLAHYLIGMGVKGQSLVGVCLERNCDLVIALLAVLKAGAAYVPLDPAYPRERLAFMATDSGLKILLTQARWADALSMSGVSTVLLDGDWERVSRESDQNPGVAMSPDDVAYVIYTSGSTGQPKGVLGLHRGAVNRFTWMWKKYPFAAGEVACAKTSLSFVDSIWEIFGPLLAGVRTILISEDVTRDPGRLIAALGQHQVTRLVLVPSLLNAMLEAEPNIKSRLPFLKYWISSGEPLAADLVQRFRQSMPGATLLNLYGSSEVSADVTCYDTGAMQAGQTVLAGRPIANTQIYILDGNFQPVPIGVSGQLCVSGDGLARGYLGQPERTAEKFIANPLGGDPKSRLYLTGDRARYQPDGNIELLGRMDDQIKIRGFRVELGEIESVLIRHSSVQQSVVIHNQAANGEPRLVAYVVLSDMENNESGELPSDELEEEPDRCWAGSAARSARDRALIPQLRRHLQKQLPDYMVPAEFVILKSMPLAPGGKIDRRALPVPADVRIKSRDAYIAPSTPAERTIQNVWSEVLQTEQVSTHENFFDLGGHSLLLARVHRKLERLFNREILSVDLYRYPTIHALAASLENGDEPRPAEDTQERARKQKQTSVRRGAILAAARTRERDSKSSKETI